MPVNQSMEDVRRRFSHADAARKWHTMYAAETERLDEANFRARRDVVVAEVMRLAHPGAKVLDAGCGAGPVVAELRKRGIDVTGLDYSQDMLDNARERLRSCNLDASGLHQGDCRDMPFADASFDIVLCIGVIAYVEDYRPVLAEIHRLLRPGGKALISFRNAFNPIVSDPVALAKYVLRSCLSPLLGARRPEPFEIGRFLDYRTVEKQVADCGLEAVGFHGIGFGPFALAGRKLFDEPRAIRISRWLMARSAFLPLPVRRWFTDVSLGVYRKPLGTS